MMDGSDHVHLSRHWSDSPQMQRFWATFYVADIVDFPSEIIFFQYNFILLWIVITLMMHKGDISALLWRILNYNQNWRNQYHKLSMTYLQVAVYTVFQILFNAAKLGLF